MRCGIAELPLHYGSAPRWLFNRMVKLARAISEIILGEFGTDEFLKRISDPVWFQSLGCVLGFDWHSSGLTTTVCGALKEGLKDIGLEYGLFVAGGKGQTSRKTPEEIILWAKKLGFVPEPLIYASKLTAKVDSAALQDGYQIYHHTFIGTKNGKWAVIQQGMNTETRWARRYHWLSWEVKDFVVEPHKAIVCHQKGQALNMVATESEKAREIATLIACEKPEKTVKIITKIKEIKLPQRHFITLTDINQIHLKKILTETYYNQPKNFKELLSISGVGPKTIRALALMSELIYKTQPSYTDPVIYSFAHGGKDGHPYPINRREYDKSIMILETAIRQAKLGYNEKLSLLRKLSATQNQLVVSKL
ncbi:MAG: DUF763 domain-containing protein [candidate division WOR-3 bacterium]|nr:DUF763 domain-containing protein [candidate division WOR-3 bacterium]